MRGRCAEATDQSPSRYLHLKFHRFFCYSYIMDWTWDVSWASWRIVKFFSESPPLLLLTFTNKRPCSSSSGFCFKGIIFSNLPSFHQSEVTLNEWKLNESFFSKRREKLALLLRMCTFLHTSFLRSQKNKNLNCSCRKMGKSTEVLRVIQIILLRTMFYVGRFKKHCKAYTYVVSTNNGSNL